MELDRQAIERRDFPISRRGYDPAAVDAHLRTIAAEVEELRRAAGAGEPSLASAASSQVQSILAAAEQAAADIEREAQEAAREARESADRDARETREQAVAKARAHAEAVEHAAGSLLDRVGGLEREAGGLTDALRAGAGRLATDLAALQGGMEELYDAAAGHTYARAVAGERARKSVPAPPAPAQPQASGEGAAAAPSETPAAAPAAQPPVPPPAPSPASPPLSPPESAAPGVHADPEAPADIDGARLVALNMALNGESRADTERYLAEHFALPDRGKLVEEVYAAIEG